MPCVLVGGVGLLQQRREVVRRSRVRRVGQPRQHFARKRRHRDRRARRVDRARQRVADLDRQDALALRRVGNVPEHHVLSCLPEAFEIGEEERAVPDDRSAKREPVLIALERRLLASGGLEEPGRVQLGVAVELPCRSAEPVGAALVGRIDRRAGAAPVFGAHVVGDHLELGHGVGRRLHHLVREALVRRAVGVVVDAVEQEIVEGRAQAVDVERPLARRRAAGVERRRPDAGAQQHQARVLAPVEGQLDDLLGRHDLAALARVGLEARGSAGHFDGLGELAGRQRQVNALPRADLHLELGSQRDREALELRGDLVAADAHGHELEAAVGVGNLHGRHAGVEVGQRDRRAGDDAAGVVLDRAQDGCGVELRDGGSRGQQHNAQQSETDGVTLQTRHGALHSGRRMAQHAAPESRRRDNGMNTQRHTAPVVVRRQHVVTRGRRGPGETTPSRRRRAAGTPEGQAPAATAPSATRPATPPCGRTPPRRP